MPKENYKQKFRECWLQQPDFKNWLCKDKSDSTKGYCKLCKCSINSKIDQIRAHMSTKKHVQNTSSTSQENKICFKPVKPSEVCSQEAVLAMFVAQHCAIEPVDHLTELCKTHFGAKSLKLHRTKCTNLIKNVVAVHFNEDLRNDLGNAKFSLLVDECTDISITKLLGVAILYYSAQREEIVSTLLSLIPINSGDSQSITEALLNELSQRKIPVSNLIGIGTDNASVMVGKNKSVFTELKKTVPSLVLVKCVCYSVQLAVNAACKQVLPEALEFIISETYAWFSKSSSRQIAYKNLYKCINNDEDPLKITRVADTRWLSIESAVKRITAQWVELKLHFQTAALSEKCHKAKILSGLYDDENYLYLVFLKPVLGEMQRINKNFQSKDVDPTKLLGDLILSTNCLKTKIIPPSVEVDVFEDDFEQYVQRDLYLGYEFESHMKLKKIDGATEKAIRICCTDFVIALINQLKQRLPDNYAILKQVDSFSVDRVLRSKKDNILPILELLQKDCDKRSKVIAQYSNIHQTKWENVDSTMKFWSEVTKYRDSGGNNPFAELVEFALTILSLPWSNAEVERVFSQVNLVKTKTRNRLHDETLNAILAVRFGLRRHNLCCHQYKLPEKYLFMIGSMATYEETQIAELEIVDETIKQLYSE